MLEGISSVLSKRNVILQLTLYRNFTTDGGAVAQQIYNTWIVIPKNYFTSIL